MRTLTRAAFGVALTALLAAPKPARALTDAEEIALGQRISPEFEMRWGGTLSDSDPLTVRVRRLGTALAALSSRRMPYSYHVLRNDKILNAFTGPGGRICITRKLVRLAANDAELASILAHETAHVDRRHVGQAFERHQRTQLQARRMTKAVFGDLVNTGENSVAALGGSIAFVIMQQGHSREKESEADAYAVRWISRLGYDPNSFISILQKMAPRKKQDKEPPLRPFLRTHPEMEQRCADVRALIAREKLMETMRANHGPRYWAPAEATPKAKRKYRRWRRGYRARRA